MRPAEGPFKLRARIVLPAQALDYAPPARVEPLSSESSSGGSLGGRSGLCSELPPRFLGGRLGASSMLDYARTTVRFWAARQPHRRAGGGSGPVPSRSGPTLGPLDHVTPRIAPRRFLAAGSGSVLDCAAPRVAPAAGRPARVPFWTMPRGSPPLLGGWLGARSVSSLGYYAPSLSLRVAPVGLQARPGGPGSPGPALG